MALSISPLVTWPRTPVPSILDGSTQLSAAIFLTYGGRGIALAVADAAGAAAGFGLLSAASWGGSDFAGGWGARRSSSLLITASGQIVSLAALLLVCLALRLAAPATSYLIYSAIGGFEGAIALAVFYRALSMGAMARTGTTRA